MGKLRVLSGREVCQILEGQGFSVVRQRGSHIIMQQRSGSTTTTVPVPDHYEHSLQHHPAIRLAAEALRALVARLAAQGRASTGEAST